MTLAVQISNDWKAALKAGLAEKTILSAMGAEIKNSAIANGIDRNAVPDEQVVAALSKMVKQRLDSAESFRSASRPDLAANEEFEISVISKYLPAAMTEEEVATIIDSLILELKPSGPKEMGKIMKELSPKIKGRFEGRKASAILADKLTAI